MRGKWYVFPPAIAVLPYRAVRGSPQIYKLGAMLRRCFSERGEERRREIFSTLAALASCWPQAVSRKLRSAAFSDYLAGLVWRCAHVHPTAFSSPPCVLACVCCALSSLCASIFLFALCLVSIVQPRKAKEEPESRTCLCTVLYSLIIVGICGGVVALLMVGGMGR
jgi:hypothetical protein